MTYIINEQHVREKFAKMLKLDYTYGKAALNRCQISVQLKAIVTVLIKMGVLLPKKGLGLD